jgi:hypothetical protein
MKLISLAELEAQNKEVINELMTSWADLSKNVQKLVSSTVANYQVSEPLESLFIKMHSHGSTRNEDILTMLIDDYTTPLIDGLGKSKFEIMDMYTEWMMIKKILPHYDLNREFRAINGYETLNSGAPFEECVVMFEIGEQHQTTEGVMTPLVRVHFDPSTHFNNATVRIEANSTATYKADNIEAKLNVVPGVVKNTLPEPLLLLCHNYPRSESVIGDFDSIFTKIPAQQQLELPVYLSNILIKYIEGYMLSKDESKIVEERSNYLDWCDMDYAIHLTDLTISLDAKEEVEAIVLGVLRFIDIFKPCTATSALTSTLDSILAGKLDRMKEGSIAKLEAVEILENGFRSLGSGLYSVKRIYTQNKEAIKELAQTRGFYEALTSVVDLVPMVEPVLKGIPEVRTPTLDSTNSL